MHYKVVKRKNPLSPLSNEKYYASAVNAGKLTIRDFAREITGRSSLTLGDIENVLENFLDELPVFLKLGLSIQLGDFCTLRLSLSNKGSDTPEEFRADMIKSAKVVFTPGVQLKNALKTISYEAQK